MSPINRQHPSLLGKQGDRSASLCYFTRRDALGALAAQMALLLGACSKPNELIVPYVRMPEGLTPGDPVQFATTLPLAGYGRGVLVTSVEGRPIKVEGNPRHPASLGATDVFLEADVLSLYDPDRSQTVQHEGQIASSDALKAALLPELQRLRGSGGQGLCLLTGRVTSPTLARQLKQFLSIFPHATWCVHEPTDEAAAREGTKLAYGVSGSLLARLQDAERIVTLDADPIGAGPAQLMNARAFGARRIPESDSFSRVYAFESVPTLIGAKADYRLALAPHHLFEVAIAIANALGAGLREASLPGDASRLVSAAVDDLKSRPGHAIVLAGRTLSAEAHALVQWINTRLSAPVAIITPVDQPDGREPRSLADFARDVAAGKVQSLFVLGGNPLYSSPSDLDLPKLITEIPFRLHAGVYANETAHAAHWHVPLSHPLESWSDLRAVDGTASIVQPLVRPLYQTQTIHEVMAMFCGEENASAYDLVRQTWAEGKADFDKWWRDVLREGVVPDSKATTMQLGEPKLPTVPEATGQTTNTLALVIRPDTSVWDGSYANNAWLQELPKPFTAEVWGNSLGLGPAEAQRLGLESGDVVRIVSDDQRLIELPVEIQNRLAPGVASASLGYGRERAGKIGNDIGTSVYLVQQSGSPWIVEDVKLTRTGKRREPLTTHNLVRADSEVSVDQIKKRYPLLSLAALSAGEHPDRTKDLPTLLPARPLPPADHAWAMVIDTSLCIGCNACVIACQAENNVPVVGPEEIARGRQMHWLRIDTYEHTNGTSPKPGFQPVPCMHCEHAPCEPVCPVAASVHDGEGLNAQVYNRCIGTRFCEANCPYKVRRFNFFGYADGQEYANLGLDPYKAQRNPEVTVRARGVMEKCTYCVQRISAARRASEREHRPIGIDEVTTACQDACPTRAIVFGDFKQEGAEVRAKRGDSRNYELLGDLGTRPRTTYLADLCNRNEKAEKPS
jgi:Fe-S-cluster-containing dehydrogenase component